MDQLGWCLNLDHLERSIEVPPMIGSVVLSPSIGGASLQMVATFGGLTNGNTQ